MTTVDAMNSNFNYASMRCISMQSSDFTNSFFKYADLTNTWGHGGVYVNTDFTGSTLRSVLFSTYSNTASDFTNAILKNVDASHASFNGANLQNTDLSQSIFIEVNLFGADPVGASFNDSIINYADARNLVATNSWFISAQIMHTNLDNSDFSNAIMSLPDFTGSTLTGVNFNAANLENTNFKHSKLYYLGATTCYVYISPTELKQVYVPISGTVFDSANLQNEDFSGLTIRGDVRFAYADLSHANFNSIYTENENYNSCTDGRVLLDDRPNFDYSILDYTDFSNSNLVNMRMNHASLIEVDMSNSNLTRADMNYSVMIRGNFYAAKMTGMNLNHASLNEAILIEADLWISHINYANFTAADLKFTEFAGANHVGAIFTNTYWFQTMWIDSFRYDTNQG